MVEVDGVNGVNGVLNPLLGFVVEVELGVELEIAGVKVAVKPLLELEVIGVKVVVNPVFTVDCSNTGGVGLTTVSGTSGIFLTFLDGKSIFILDINLELSIKYFILFGVNI